MRDPGRIRRILDLIDQAWGKYPDQRLCQLIENAWGSPSHNHCLYNVEDDALEQSLMEFYQLDT
jgi:hypothetical protein